MRIAIKSVIACSVAGLLAAPTTALAQTDDHIVTPSDRERDVSERNGVRVGSFLLLPTVLSEATYDDNVYASDTNKQDDVIFTVRPAVALRSVFANHSLNAAAFYERDFHLNLPTENSSQYGASVDGAYAISRADRVSASLSARHTIESRRSLGSLRQASRPVAFNDIDGRVGYTRTSGPLFISAEARGRRVAYGDAVVSGVTVDQSFRNFTIASGSFAAGYNFHDITRVFLSVGAEHRRYEFRAGDIGFDPITNTDRSANGYRVELGAQRELTALISGTVRVGYFNFNYADTKLKDVSGFSYFGDLRWSVTPLTTITLAAQRSLDETVSPNSAGNLRDQVTLGADHELLRNLFLQGSVRYAWIDSTGTDPNSREFGLDLEGRYYLGRNLMITAGYSRSSRSSANRAIAFRDNAILLGIRFNP